MNAIKFSHVYPKLHGQTTAELLAVRRIKIDAHTPPELLEYDTSYEGGRYPLRSGDYLQLVFIGNLHIPFCTLRSAYPASKVAYYQGQVGKMFAIDVREVVRDYSTCKHFKGECQRTLPFGGVECVEVQCDICPDATPDNCAKHCVFYQRRGGAA